VHIAYASFPSALGAVCCARSERGLVALDLDASPAVFAQRLLARGFIPAFDADALPDVAAQIEEYAAGERRAFDIPLDLSHLTPFRQEVIRAVCAIPYGEWRSYGRIAEAIGRPRAARAAGTAMATCPISLIVPCHRVVRAGVTPKTASGDAGERARLALIRFERRVARELL